MNSKSKTKNLNLKFIVPYILYCTCTVQYSLYTCFNIFIRIRIYYLYRLSKASDENSFEITSNSSLLEKSESIMHAPPFISF